MKKVLFIIVILYSVPANAKCFLGDLYYNKGDFKRSVNSYNTCADAGDIESMYNIANFNYLGKEIPKNFTRALNYYEMASENGYAPAQVKAALMYWRGEGEKQNLIKALAYLILASDGKDKKWFYPAMNDELAAKNEDVKSLQYMKQLLTLVTPEQKNQAIIMASEIKFSLLKRKAKEILTKAEYDNFIDSINKNSQNKKKLDAVILNLYKTYLLRKNNNYE